MQFLRGLWGVLFIMTPHPMEERQANTERLTYLSTPDSNIEKVGTMNQENLGPLDRILQTVLAYTDHMVHNRPGTVVPDARAVTGLRWQAATYKVENGQKIVYNLQKSGRKSLRIRLGVLQDDAKVVSKDGIVLATYRGAGIFPEVAVWLYRQVAEVWKLDNEFAARWASYAFAQEHRDLKVVLAAFMLVQCRKGDPVRDDAKVAFFDEDFRDIGEAMMLLQRKDGRDLNPKLLLRVREVLRLPGVVEINRQLGFGRTARRPFFGRWDKAVTKWLHYREENPRMLEGLVKAGFRRSVMDLARAVGYRPQTPRFFEILRWKQCQADDGRRTMAIGKELVAAESWDGLVEREICERILRDKPSFKRIVGLLPREVGMTRAIVAASIDAGALSDKDLVIFTPTLEELGLMQVQAIRERWEKATRSVEDMRSANIARRVRNASTRAILEEASETALKKAVEETMKGIRVYFMVDISGSMEGAIDAAKTHISKFLHGFPLDKVHVAVFNTAGRELRIPHASSVGVQNAFRGIVAGGGTDYGAGVRALAHHKPSADEDFFFIFVGDEEAQAFDAQVRASGLQPMAFGFVKVRHSPNHAAVRDTAARLGIPCFIIDERSFEDAYAIPRTIRALVAATPVGNEHRAQPGARQDIAQIVLQTELLKKPPWAA